MMTDADNRINGLSRATCQPLARGDPAYCMAHDCERTTDEDFDTAIQAGEDVLEAAEVEY
jgi:hypothetical protein